MLGTNTYNQGFPLQPNKTKQNKFFCIKALPVLFFTGLAGSLIFGLCPLPAMAQSADQSPQEPSVQHEVSKAVRKDPNKNFLSLSYENDLVGDGEDKYYTSGVRLTYFNTDASVPPVIDRIADAVPQFDINKTTSTFFTLGQNLYTPSDITRATPNPNERPYAAWLYGSVGLSSATTNHIDDFEITLGVVGPQALGEQTQKFIHKNITDSPEPKGWDNQLKFEPGLILSWQRRWPRGFDGNLFMDFGNDLRLQAEPNINVNIGNIYTYAGTGIMFTFGPYQETLQDTPPRVKPAMSGTGYFTVPDQDWSWYTFAGVDARAVARNIFLDGNSFRDSPSVDKKILVGDAVAGLAFTFDDYRLSYTANYRTKEFDGQPKDTVFGSITLTTRF